MPPEYDAAAMADPDQRPTTRHASRSRPGAFVVVVGPDGVGKTSVARAMVDSFEGSTAYFHFRAPLLAGMDPRPPDTSRPPPNKGDPDGSIVLGWLRLIRTVIWCWIGYLGRIRPALRRGVLVVGDRWGYGYVVQPRAVKFYGPAWLARAAARTLPRPHLVINLTAPAEMIHQRKQELEVDEIRQELAAWERLDIPTLRSFSTHDPPEEIARAVLQQLGW